MSERFDDIVFPMDHPWIAEHRLPCVQGWHADWSYPVALNVMSQEWEAHPVILPTDEEVALLASYNAHRSNGWYTPEYLAKVRQGPLDVDPGISTYVFGKDAEQSWRYKSATWETGVYPNFAIGSSPRYPFLIDLLQKIERNFESRVWAGWEEKNREIITAADKSNA